MTTITNRTNVDAALQRAAALRPGAAGSKDTAQNLIGELKFHQNNLSRAVSRCCASGANERGKQLANEKLAPVAAAIAKLSREHNLGTSMKLPAAGLAAVGLSAAHYMGYLSPVLAKAATYIPKVSMPPISMSSLGSVGSAIASASSFIFGGSLNVTKAIASTGIEGIKFGAGTIANATGTVAAKAAATASAVDGIWGVSALLPSATALAIGTGIVAAALLTTFVAKQCMNKAKQA